MADLLPTDKLLVNRAGVDYSVPQSDVMATVQDSDLFLVNRAGTDYNATYADVKKGFGPQHIDPAPGDWTFSPAIVSGTGTQADPFVVTPETIPAPGGSVLSAQTLTLTGLTPDDLVIWTELSTGNGNRFDQHLVVVPPSGQVDLRLSYHDTPDSTATTTYTADLQIGTSYFRWVITQNALRPPDVGTVVLSDGPGGDRFTSENFPVAVTMIDEGLPVSTKGMKGWVEGALKQNPVSSAITNVTSTPGPTATMHGLRFETARDTSLTRGTQVGSTYTASVWVKFTNTNSKYPTFLGSSGSEYVWQIHPDLTSINVASVSSVESYTHTFPANKWINIVAKQTSTSLEVFVDGVSLGSRTVTAVPFQALCLNKEFVGVQGLNGYFSDVYFVDGQALDATAFGQDFGGTWGPLDSSAVKTNIATAGGFGTNGFFLPFDPAATSSPITYDYEGKTSSSSYGNALSPKIDVPLLFNGIVNPIDPYGAGLASGYHSKVDAANQASGSTITFSPGIPIPPGATVEIWGAEQGSYQGIRINGKSQAGYNTSYTAQLVDWTATLAGDTEITSIACTISTNPGEVSAITGIVINGYLLGGSYKSIGVDDSGNDNDFHDQNFALNSTGQIWSNTITATGSDVAGTLKELFNGNLSSGSSGIGTINSAAGTTTVTLSGFTLNNSTVTIYYANNPAQTTIDSINAGDKSIANPPAGGSFAVLSTTLTGCSGSDISLTATYVTGLGSANYIIGIEVDGELLVDGNIVDTVLDEPTNNYATLVTGSNGNLVATAAGTDLTYKGVSGTDYYYEEDGVGKTHPGAATFASVDGKIYNFGQLPFAGTQTPGTSTLVEPFSSGSLLELTDNTQFSNFAVGDAVTELGNADDGTGTIVAIDGSATPPTMELKPSGGTWDVGSQVKGPLKTLNVKLQTDEIVAEGLVAGPPYATGVSVSSAALPTTGDPADIFSADENAGFFVDLHPNTGVQGSIIMDFDPPLEGSLEVKVTCGTATNGTFRKLQVNGTDTIVPAGASNQWVTVGDTGPVSHIGYVVRHSTNPADPVNRFGVHAIRLNGGAHLEGSPQVYQLTFKSDKDLASFTAGDAIQQENYDATLSSVTIKPKAGTTANAVLKGVKINGTELRDSSGVDYSSALSGSSTNYNGGPFADAANGYREGSEIIWDASSFFDPKDIYSFILVISSGSASGGTYEIFAGGAKIGELSFPDDNSYDKDITGFIVDLGAVGTVDSVDATAKTMILATSEGTWGPANAGHYVIGPEQPAANVKLYTVLNNAGVVSDLTSTDPGFVTQAATPTQITFPAVLPTGNAPDVDLPAGTTLTVEVNATNAAGTDAATSNTITPA